MKRVLEPRGPAAAFLLSDEEVAEIGGGKKVFPVVLDDAPREVEVPLELAAALGELRPAFDALSYTVRKEHARAVTEAKQDATRERRIAKIVDQLR